MQTLSAIHIWARVVQWREMSGQRRQLKRDLHSLSRDLGISVVDLEREANRPFWDIEPKTETPVEREQGISGKVVEG